MRSLNSAVLKWPDREAVLASVRRWAADLRRRESGVVKVGCVGSYARGDWGVGSDVDIIVVLSDSSLSREERYRRYYPNELPVETDLWVYTQAEWTALATRSPHLHARLEDEWLDLE